MKRKILFIAILVCIISLCSCNSINKSEKTYDKPPVLTVECGDNQVTALLGTHTWNWTDSDGRGQGIASDHPHPLNIKEHVPVLNAVKKETTLQFEDSPNTVSVVCWSDEYWNDTSDDGEEIAVNENSFKLKYGGYIYQVRAKWNDKTSHNGEATYSFYAELK